MYGTDAVYPETSGTYGNQTGNPAERGVPKIKRKRDQEIADIMIGKDDRFLLIIGPCSADNEPAVLDYCSRLAKVADEVKNRLFIVPRVYTNKPRTIGKGTKVCCTSRIRRGRKI